MSSGANASDINNPPAEKSIKEGTATTTPSPSPILTGYTFAGWYTEVTTTTQFNFTTKITKATTLSLSGRELLQIQLPIR